MNELGRVQIRIRRDGTVYLEGMNEGLLELAFTLSPEDANVRRRFELLREVRSRRQEQLGKETDDGHAEAGE